MIPTTAPPAKLKKVTERRVLWVASRPVTFAEFLDRFGEDDDVELVDGVVVAKMAAQLEHERFFAWLFRLLGDYVEERALGIVLGSRTAVEINEYRGRLPDLLFVRRERLDIVQEKAVFGAPDLVVEFVSPNDRPSDLIARETDYRGIGVAEIVFVNPHRQQVRVLRKRNATWDEQTLSAGDVLALESVEGFSVNVDWLLAEPRPAVRATLDRLLAPS